MENKPILFISQYAGFIGGLERYIHGAARLLRESGMRTASLFVEKTKESDTFLSAFDEVYDISRLSEISERDFRLTTLHKISNPDVLEKILGRFSPTVFMHDHDYFCPKGYKYYPYKRINCTRPYSRLFCGACASIVPPRHMTNGFAAMLRKNFCEIYRLNRLIKTCPRYVVLSQFMKRELQTNGIPAEKIEILHPFLIRDANAPAARVAAEKKVPHIVFAGQQVMSKGTPFFLEAIRLLKNDVRAHVLGTGPRLEYFKSLSQEMGLGEKVKFEGWVNNPDDFFAAADIAVFPSMWQEPFGLAGIEAMSRGLPVVGFDVGGVSEWLKDGVNGRLIPPQDCAEMARAIDYFIENPSERERIGAQAKKFVEENYAPSKYADNFKKLL